MKKKMPNSIDVRRTIDPPIIVAMKSKYSIPAGMTRSVEVNAK